MQDELTSSYFVTIWKMLRKKGCVPSALTQNVKDLLASRQIENIFENSDFMEDYELRPAPGNPDRAARPSITAQLKEAARRPEPPKEPDKTKHNKSHEDR